MKTKCKLKTISSSTGYESVPENCVGSSDLITDCFLRKKYLRVCYGELTLKTQIWPYWKLFISENV